MAFFVQAAHNPRLAVYVALQFVRKLSVDGHPINVNGQVSLFVYAAQGRL